MGFILSYFVALLALFVVSFTILQLSTHLSTQTLIKYESLTRHRPIAYIVNPGGRDDLYQYHYQSDAWGHVLWCFLWDLSLTILFVVQHSVMASRWWKDLMQDFGLRVISRAIYAIISSLCLQVLMKYWILLPVAPVWYVDTSDRPFLYLFFWLLHAIMWLLIFGAALTMDFPELIGIKQVYYADQGFDSPMSYKSPEVRRLYQGMRHAGVWCMLVVLWVHPAMTLDRWALATVWTIYLLMWFTVTPTTYSYVEAQYLTKHRSRTQTEHVRTEYYQR